MLNREFNASCGLPTDGSPLRDMTEKALKPLKKQIKLALLRANRQCPPLVATEVTVDRIVSFIKDLTKPDGEPLGFSSLSGYRSAIGWMLKEHTIPLPDNFEPDMNPYFQALKRANAKAVAQGKGEIKVGKSPIPLSAYGRLMHLALTQGLTFVFTMMMMTTTTTTTMFLVMAMMMNT